MKTETKVELLKYLLLHQSYDYDMILYNLIYRRRLNDEVSKIDERTFSFKVDAGDAEITAKQFLVNMNEFIRCMRFYFYNISTLTTSIEDVVDGSKEALSNLLSYRCNNLYSYPIDKEDSNFKELIYKLIISNFISNAKYVDSIKSVLEDIQVPLKKVEEYDLEESCKILNLLSDLAFCQRGRGPVIRLFESMDNRLQSYSEMDVSRRKKSRDDFKKKYIDSCIEDYDKMIKSYHSKLKYLKYFT